MEEATLLLNRGGLRFWLVSLRGHISKRGDPKCETVKLRHYETYFDGLADLMVATDMECQCREVPYCLALVLLLLPEPGQ